MVQLFHPMAKLSVMFSTQVLMCKHWNVCWHIKNVSAGHAGSGGQRYPLFCFSSYTWWSDQGLLKDWTYFWHIQCSIHFNTYFEKGGNQTHQQYAEASKVVMTNFYVDNLLIEVDTLEQATLLRVQPNGLLLNLKFLLCKWRTNFNKLLQTIPEELQEKQNVKELNLSGEHLKTLGILWDKMYCINLHLH